MIILAKFEGTILARSDVGSCDSDPSALLLHFCLCVMAPHEDTHTHTHLPSRDATPN